MFLPTQESFLVLSRSGLPEVHSTNFFFPEIGKGVVPAPGKSSAHLALLLGLGKPVSASQRPGPYLESTHLVPVAPSTVAPDLFLTSSGPLLVRNRPCSSLPGWGEGSFSSSTEIRIDNAVGSQKDSGTQRKKW